MPAAREFAERFVGRAVLEAAMADGEIGRRIGQGVEMLAAAGGGKLPKVLLPEVVVWGRVPGVKELVGVVEGQLKLTRPAGGVESGARGARGD